MFKAIGFSLSFMTPMERFSWWSFAVARSSLAVLDLAGVLAVGLILTSTALFLTRGSDPNREISLGGVDLVAVNATTLPWVAVAVLALFLSKAGASVVLTRQSALFVARVEARSVKAIASFVFGGDLTQVRKRSREEVMFAIGAGSPAAFHGLLGAAATLLAEGTLFVLIIIGFLLVDPVAALGTLLYFLLVATLIQFSLGSALRNAGEVARKSTIKADTAVSSLVSVFRELSVLGKRPVYIDHLYQARLAAAKSAAASSYLSSLPRHIVESALLIGVGIFVTAQAISGDIVQAAGTLGVFLAGGYRLTAALLPLQSALLSIRTTMPAAATAQRILLESESVIRCEADQAIQTVPVKLIGPLGVKLEKVSFGYSDGSTLALQDINLEVPAGCQVAIIGISGSGKSTLTDLICGLIEPDVGTVAFNMPEGMFAPTLGTGRVAYVPQKPGMIPGTIAENVALGEASSEIDRALVSECLKRSQLESVVAGLPEGMDSDLGKLQDRLSGGQFQRLGLARALYSRPSLLIMDEATSALDAESESQIYRALNRMRGEVTVVMIAHRLNTVQHADKVFLIESGRIVDSGTFQDLLARNHSIQRLVELMRVGE